MAGFRNPFARGDEAELFDPYDAFVAEHVPEPGPFLSTHEVLGGNDHVAFHRLTRELFEARGVYDMTFNYNLARLNLDTRHPDAGYRYAVERDDPSALRAEFTPTTPFCPQCHTLAIGSFRAWNGLADRHEYDLVRVRANPMHHDSDWINDQLERLEEAFEETGDASVRIGGDTATDSEPRSPASSEGGEVPF
ncbi:hypothetical protein [Halovivax gelatinilyticus]|uniref:hypothetical protein n=1 Tax=Halovivax gelatinilyticus TaxID=2961597 RepID=UPI0020CA7D3F|nr:hypothetical protein [Halovivax gelatinilyticus]